MTQLADHMARRAATGASSAGGPTVLQPGTGPVRGDVYLPSTPETVLWGRLPSAADTPVVTVAPGTTVTVDTVSHEGLLPGQGGPDGGDPIAYFTAHGVPRDDVLWDATAVARHCSRTTADGPHVVTGPIAVRGAHPGDLLAVQLIEHVRRVPYGVISNRHGKGALAGELPRTPGDVSVFTRIEGEGAEARGVLPLTEGGPGRVRFPLAEFLGILGVAAPGARRHSVPPGVHGGNIDVNLMTAGSTVYLPVQTEGALFYVGDPHYAQGDGEVALTALEAPLRSTFRLDVIPRDRMLREFGPVTGPLVRTAGHLVPTGMDEDLDEAMRRCVRAALELLTARYGMAEHLAYAYLSAATDFHVSQVVDQVKGVHAKIRLSDFEETPK
ncbi:acetamidase/formamidase family protein [Streptomyces tendae]|uniref:acetamidase/formamidase family protein n=1 Tax=Streptomyces tendae TaxID=1932 RepID=UPI00367EF100